MNLEEDLREKKESIKELTESFREYEAKIKVLRKAIRQLHEQLQKAKTKEEGKRIQSSCNDKMHDLSLAVNHLTGLSGRYNVLIQSKTKIVELLAKEKFQNSSGYSSLDDGFEAEFISDFERNSRLDLQKELWQLYKVAFSEPNYYSKTSRKLEDENVLEIVKKHYPQKVNEKTIYIYALIQMVLGSLTR
jgi:phage shock protein A